MACLENDFSPFENRATSLNVKKFVLAIGTISKNTSYGKILFTRQSPASACNFRGRNTPLMEHRLLEIAPRGNAKMKHDNHASLWSDFQNRFLLVNVIALATSQVY